MRSEVFVRELTRLAVAFAEPLDEMRLAVYRDRLRGFSDANMQRAVNAALDQDDRFPSVARLKALGYARDRAARPTWDTTERQLPLCDRPEIESGNGPGREKARALFREVIAKLERRYSPQPVPVTETGEYDSELDTDAKVRGRHAELRQQAARLLAKDPDSF